MAFGNQFDIVATFRADVGNFKAAVRDASDSLKGFKSEADKLGDMGKTLAGVGAAFTAGITVPVGLAAKASVDSFMEMETAMRGVSKTIDMTESEFEAMKSSILDMSRSMPVAATEIAGVAEAAGQLGIEKKHVLDFTETMIKLGTSTNMSSEEAATSLARLANITQMPQTEFERLGSVVVELGNNMATTEKEIVDMSLRLAGTGSQIGLTEAQIMALSGAMTSVGINAEAGGSAFSRVMQKINSDVLGGSANVENFARVAGMSASEFAETWRNDPQTAIVEFIKGLGRVQETGGDVAGTLAEMGINGIREVDTLSRLAGAGELTADAFDMANNAWEENTALSKEAEEAWSTLESQTQIFKNALFELGETIGKILAPALTAIVEGATDVIHAFIDMDERFQIVIIAIAGLAAAIGPILVAFGGLLALIPAMAKGWATLTAGAKVLAAAFTKTGIVGKLLGTVLAGLKVAIGVLTGPIGVVVAAIGAFVGALIYLYNTNEEVRNLINSAWEAIKNAIGSAIEAVSSFIMDIWGRASEWFTNNQETIQAIVETVWNAIVTAVEAALIILVPIVQTAWETIKVITQTAWELIKTAIEVVLEAINGIIDVFFAVLSGDWEGAWNAIKDTAIAIWEVLTERGRAIFDAFKEYLSNLWEIIKGVTTSVWNTIKGALTTLWEGLKSLATTVFNAIKTVIQTVWNSIKAVTSSVWNNIKSLVSGIWNGIKALATSVFNAIKNIITTIWNAIRSTTSSIWNGIKSLITSILNAIKSTFSNIFNSLKGIVTNAFGRVRSAVSSGMNNALSTVTGFFGSFRNAGSNIVQNIANGIKGAVGKVTGAVKGVLSAARNLLPFSPPKDKSSPLVDIHKNGIITQIAKGIENDEGKLVDAMSHALGYVNDVLDSQKFEAGIGVSDAVNRANAQVNSHVNHEFGSMELEKQPMLVNLNIGGQNFTAFVENISSEQGRIVDLEAQF